MDYVKLSSSARKCMYVKSFVRTVILILVVIPASIFSRAVLPGFVLWIGIGLAVFALAWSIITPSIRHKIYMYRLTDEELEVRHGLIIINREIIPVERLHKIEITSGPIYRAFGLDEVEVTTAGSSLTISYLDKEVASEIADRLKNRINQIVISEKESEAENE